MTVAMRATSSARRARTRTAKVTPLDQKRLTVAAPPKSDQTVKELPNPGSLSPWLRSLQDLKQGSKVVTSILVGACLSVYGWTVYSQQMWNQQSRQLESLRRTEQQLAAANEVLKHQMAQQAERPGMGLVAPDPAQMIFLEPAPPRYVPPTPSRPSGNLEESLPNPFGY